MIDEKEKKVETLANDIERYLQKQYYNRLFWILHCTDNNKK